jgi:alpha-mannosidase
MSLVRGHRRGYIRKPDPIGAGRSIITMLDEWTDMSDKPIVGMHHVKYAICGHKGDWKAMATPRKGYEFNYSLLTISEPSHSRELPPSQSFIEISPENVILTVVKKAEDTDDIIIRLFEACNIDTEAVIHFDRAPTSVRETDLVEWGKYIEEKKISIKGNNVTVPVAHSEIKTLKVHF